MTTASQREANRINAQSSTGPQTAAGKRIASRGALKHGLSIRIITDPEAPAKIEALARLILGESSDPELLRLARSVAEAEVDLNRIRNARNTLLLRAFSDPDYDSKRWLLMKSLVASRLACGLGPPTGLISGALFRALCARVKRKPGAIERLIIAYADMADKLIPLDRYERRALSRRKSAIRAFDAAKRGPLHEGISARNNTSIG